MKDYFWDGTRLKTEYNYEIDQGKTANQISYGKTGKTEKLYGIARELAKCNLFTASLLEIDGKTEVHCEDSFISLLVLEGKMAVKW